MSQVEISCAYCFESCVVEQPEDFEGRYEECPSCGKRFIYERSSDGMRTWTLADAPCCSDPNCRETELSQGDEE